MNVPMSSAQVKDILAQRAAQVEQCLASLLDKKIGRASCRERVF